LVATTQQILGDPKAADAQQQLWDPDPDPSHADP
jgi:hypothetical protein